MNASSPSVPNAANDAALVTARSAAPRCRLDHLVVAASSLDAGAAYVKARLGREMEPGGRHARMGTHNRLLSLGPGCYLEVIAIDPEAPAPGRARWFGLDGPEVAPLLAAGPRLLTWVAATEDLDAAVARSPWDHGAIETMSRGDLHWRITIPGDGALRQGGLVPTLIEWPAGVHPSARLNDVGVRLLGLELADPEPGPLRSGLEALGLADVEVRPEVRSALRARLQVDGRQVILD